jgi:hypothetical protein
MNQTTIYIGIGVVVLIVIIVAVMMSRKKTEVKTETKTEVKTEVISCNLGSEFQNGECKFVGCPSGFYNDMNEKKCKRRTKVCPQPQRACETVTENPNADECITDISRCCNLGYEFQNGECKFVGCPSGFYNDMNEKKCKNRTKVCPQPQRACETVTENPNADDCITDISRCCKENEFEYNGQCRTDCPTGTIVSGNKCVAGNCPQGFYNSDSNKGGKYRDSKGICQDYNNAFTKYKQIYLSDPNKQCKNVVFNPNADDITITNKPPGSSCSLNEGESGRCDNGECKFAGCASGFFDKGNRICVRDCIRDGDGTNKINNTVNRTCVSSCPANTYYNKIMNGAAVVRNECVSDCRNVQTENFFGESKPSFNYKDANNKGFCINCRQDQQYRKIGNYEADKIALKNATLSFQDVYDNDNLDKEIARSSYNSAFTDFYNTKCLKFS